MSFPTTLDSFPSAATLSSHTLATDKHSDLHGALGAAIAALQVKVGIDSSADTNSLDYKAAHAVLSFNSRVGAVTLSSGDVTGALGYTPAVSGSGVTTFNTRTGGVTLQTADVSGVGGVLTSGSYSDPSWITSLAGSKITGNISGNAASITGSITESQVTGLVGDLSALSTSIALKAPLANPTFTGVPAGPTAAGGTNTTQLATTAFVQSYTPATISGSITESQVTSLVSDLALKSPLASPTFTGTPAMPTAVPGTNTTQGATTAFVTAAVAAVTLTSISQGGGSVSVGSDGTITSTTASGKAWTVNGTSSSLISLTTAGAITLTPASGQNVTLSSGNFTASSGKVSGSAFQGTTSGYVDLYDSSSLMFRAFPSFWETGTASPNLLICGIGGGTLGSFNILSSSISFGIHAPSIDAVAYDLILWRDGPGISAQRNSTNSQTQRWYETYTDVSNGAWLEVVAQTGGPHLIRCNNNGTGSLRTIWYQNNAGNKRNTADVPNATATMANLADLSITLIAGRKYMGRLVLVANDSVGADGLAIDCNGGTATMTSFQMTAEEAPIGATLGTTNSTALGTALTNTVVATTDTAYVIYLTMVVNAGGTFIPRFAQNAHTTGTATVRLGSSLVLDDSRN